MWQLPVHDKAIDCLSNWKMTLWTMRPTNSHSGSDKQRASLDGKSMLLVLIYTTACAVMQLLFWLQVAPIFWQ